jgi:protein TonB
LEEETVRVLKKATKWEPAIQNGNKVKAYRRQVITFDVLEE